MDSICVIPLCVLRPELYIISLFHSDLIRSFSTFTSPSLVCFFWTFPYPFLFLSFLSLRVPQNCPTVSYVSHS
ncbi:hypothetical protein BDV24DRAFT_60535 [Aspergillus arachidicola]|uniref:Uncharacterized protein n=1 Tax=Aspergillus arachidicola TaxID=656916 RepID=A0A5N6Y5W8_9EURO|nr:hypothetical protein BDV24DRAFT_60535 [Aspergillus arachidicola]